MRFLWQTIACSVVAYGFSLVIGIPANPEIRLWRHVDQVRNREIAEVRRNHPEQPLIFFAGGSSCAFSIDPRIIEEKCGMPAFNLGLPVAAGGGYLLHQALCKARAGDILVVTLEPDLLTTADGFDGSRFSFAMALLSGQPGSATGGSSFGKSLSPRDYLNLSRPGPDFIATWIAKMLTGRGYRYKLSDMRYRGRMETPFKAATDSRAREKAADSITPQAREQLLQFQRSASEMGLHLVYTMPWMLTEKSAAINNRAVNRRILDSIHPVIPIIDDGFLGVATDPSFFADSGLHLTATGSRIRSEALATALHQWLGQSTGHGHR
jgi:hypothetical protein